MRKLVYALLTTLAVMLVGCVTINVYFPEAAVQQAADQFIGNVLDGTGPAPASSSSRPPVAHSHPPAAAMLLDLLVPAAYAADTPDIRIQTTATLEIRARMQSRFRGILGQLFDSGAMGFDRDGMLAVHDASRIPPGQRAQATAAMADENRDRADLYRDIAAANGHPEWAEQIQAAFARGWITQARAGWYYQDTSGAWRKK